ncbi:hypothetical protein CPB84DRAFT_1774453 [Gymnopilus junonius]|uniref:DUF6534 domain-containing protein n=1 Tax=Gymnopilus junonius TaxID=109634 RepID=A0A9P5TPS6_GYMJU|nr:hypothetical protein CPB84DRAFT_1774453 [Gymnopilus junonius]
MVVPIGVSSYYIPRIYFLAGLEKAPIRNFNELVFFGQAAVWGLTVSQIFQYFFNYSEDPLNLKIFAASLWFLDAAHQFLTTYIVTSLFMNGKLVNIFSKRDLLFFNLTFLFTALVSVLSQSFYIYQICIFTSRKKASRCSRSLVLPVIMAPFVLFQFVLPLVLFLNTTSFSGVNFYDPSTDVIDRFQLQQDLLLTTMAVNLGVNFVTFFSLALHMRKLYFGSAQSLTFERDTSLPWRIFLFTVNTGMWTTFYSVLSLVAFCLLRVNSTYIVLHFHCLSALYCTSILANMNARDYLRPVGDHIYLPSPEKRLIPGLTGIEINTLRMEPLDFRTPHSPGLTIDSTSSLETESNGLSTPKKINKGSSYT